MIRADISPTQNSIITIVTAVGDPIPLVTADQYAAYGLANKAPTSSATTPPAASAVMSKVLNTTKKTTQNARNTTAGKNASALPSRKTRPWSVFMALHLGQLEVLLGTLEPGQASSDEEWSHAAVECAYVITGTVTVHVAGQIYDVRAGEALTFDATRPHRYTNDTNEPASYLTSVTPPTP
ncbi:cupin domain-containing protein [Streptomyces sp. NPDC001750]|uniref:cupin domain-containing protein n=1 Tax=Streptomyces sp. NPDC001750 TaxID=3364607 RepID=UPI0036BF62C5